jgi:hypothetical protein
MPKRGCSIVGGSGVCGQVAPPRQGGSFREYLDKGSSIGFLIFISSSLLSLSVADQMPTVLPTNSVVDQFKSFISSPPPIQELTFSEKGMPFGIKLTLERGLEKSTNFEAFVARWQPNGRTIYQVLDPSGSSTNTILRWFSVGAFQNKYWHMLPTGNLIYWQDAGAVHRQEDRSNVVLTGNEYLNYRLAQVMNMGVFGLEIGSINWKGNSFCETNINRRLKIEGTLLVSDTGRPSELKLHVSSPTNAFDFRIFYSFETNIGLPYLPSRIRRVYEGSKNTTDQQFAEIKSIVVATNLGEELSFAPATNLLSTPVVTRYYTNGAYYAFDAKGKLVPSPLSVHDSSDAKQLRAFYLIVWTAISVTVFVLMIRTKVKHKPNELYSEPRKEST